MPIAGAPRRVTAPPDGPARPKTLALLLKGGASAASRSTAALDENRKLYRPAIRVSLPHECGTLAVEVLSDSRRSWTVYRCPARPRSPDRAQVLDARKSAAVSASSRPAPPPLGRAARPHRPAPARRTALRPARLTCRRRGGETLPFMGTEESAGSWAGLPVVVHCGDEVGTERDARFPGERSSLEQRHWDKAHTRHRGENRGEMNRAY